MRVSNDLWLMKVTAIAVLMTPPANLEVSTLFHPLEPLLYK